MTPSFKRRSLITLAASCLLAAAPAWAQSTAPLRVILPLGAGSGVDTIVRAAQNALSKALGGQAVVIENLPGAGGITGTSAIVKAAPDGNTVGFISNNHAVNPIMFKNMPYDSLADITPISVVGGSPFVLVVNPNKVPAKNAKELQAFLKSKPGAYNLASSGNGTIIHLAGEMFVDAAEVQVQHVPYKGMGPMMTDIIAGQVEFGVAAVAAAQGHLASGRMKAIGVMGKQRVPSLPDVPTIAEQGFPDVDVAGWFAMVGPKGLPAAQVERLHKAVVAAFNDPEVKVAMAKQDNVINPTTPEAAARFLRSEQDRYARLVAKANIKLD
ncbi:Bug family tripartite tricarboxylate transporter substrate binding protein [Hydrogenophaga pseudoflava]|uniref:Bug family tripartite tricarboxylate transporter substrate binding protein n=1 Tax=Hydrogenophaga pseudoflava TaxID=47421 RepID=UPI0027E55F90|nr:tripartite tricarboxylate transporter substrate binding protein [Hydrogenophaga pseudoflava]MDQ7743917.1 tripartite tricarboxylate transporter substrate binding protein [Hydrogenophaga pseudoflava]